MIATRLPAREKLRGARAVASGDNEWVWFISYRGDLRLTMDDVSAQASCDCVATG